MSVSSKAAPLLNDITPVILTFDEAPNIGRCLERLAWARDIVVVDSGSTDATLEICAHFPQVRVFSRSFDNHAAQWNHAVHETGVGTAWVLCLDADYIIPEEVAREIEALRPAPDLAGYWLSFRYAIMGRPLRSGIYPPVLALFRRARGRHVQDGHTQRAVVDGATMRLTRSALHDDRKPLDRWVRSQTAYARLEAEKLEKDSAGLKGALRTRTPFAPLAVCLYCLIWRGGLFEGPAGWLYAAQRTIAEGMILASYVSRRLGG
jgi:glycosyltransferase involved in cell wall biosynthesis